MSVWAAPSRGQDAAPALLGLRNSDSGAPLEPLSTADAVSNNPEPDAPALPDAQKDKPPKKQARRKPQALPALQPYAKAQRAGLPGGPAALDPALTPPPTVAALPPIPAKYRPPTLDDKPYDPLGIR